jgi:hypothetical protein
MGLLIDEMGKPRWAGGGLMLLVLLGLLLLPPLLRNKDINHPRSAEQNVDLCPLLPEPPTVLREARPAKANAPGTPAICGFKNAAEVVELSVGMTTTREASVSGPVRTTGLYKNWMKEVVASGAVDAREQPGDWAMASSYRFGDNNQVLIEDHGVLLNLSSTKLGADALTTYARAVAVALRKPATQP